jgi:hypothetical protein
MGFMVCAKPEWLISSSSNSIFFIKKKDKVVHVWQNDAPPDAIA